MYLPYNERASEVQLLNIGQDIKNNYYVLFTKKLF